MNGAADNKHLSPLSNVCVCEREKLPCDLFLKVYLSLSISTCILSLNIARKSLSPSNHSSHFSFTLLLSVLWRAFTHAFEQLGTHMIAWILWREAGAGRLEMTSLWQQFHLPFFFFFFHPDDKPECLTVGERVHFCQNPPSGGNILWPVGGSLLWGPQLLSGKGLGLCQILPPAPQVK